MLIRLSILRMMEGRPELRLCSILIPVKKVTTNSARESAFIFGRSTSIFLAMSRFSLLLFRVMTPIASGGNMANSRMELTAKHPFCPSMLHGPILRNRSMLFQPKGLGCQQSLLLETFKVVPKALHKQILFIFELGVEAGFVHPGRLFQFVKTGVRKPAPPKNRQRFL